MNRKAVFLSFFLMLLAAGIYTQAYFVLQNSRATIESEGKLGERAAYLYDLEQANQRVQVYVDHSASLATGKAIDNLMKAGGFVDVNCGSYSGVPYWRGVNRRETLAKCAPDLLEELRAGIGKVLPSYLKEYPRDGYLTTIPTQFHYILDENEGVDVLGVALAPLIVKVPRTVSAIQYSEKIVSYPSFRVKSEGLNALHNLADEAEKLISECTESNDVEGCVNEHTKLDHGAACGVASTGRTIVFCKDVRGVLVKFALYFPDSLVLDIIKFDMIGKGPMDWLEGNQVLGVRTGRPVSIDVEVGTPNPGATSVMLCSDTCELLFVEGEYEEEVLGDVGKKSISVKYSFIPAQKGYYIKAVALGDEVGTPLNHILLSD
ncbi:MAG: hypothetical protein ACE5FT_02385 [Candidatus Nanoarchaeia archaeon]